MSALARVISGVTNALNFLSGDNANLSPTRSQPSSATFDVRGLEHMISLLAPSSQPITLQDNPVSASHIQTEVNKIFDATKTIVKGKQVVAHGIDRFVAALAREVVKKPFLVTAALHDKRYEAVRSGLARNLAEKITDGQMQSLGRTNEGRKLLQDLRNIIENEGSEVERRFAEPQDKLIFARMERAIQIGETQRQSFVPVTVDQLVSAMKIHGLSREKAEQQIGYLNDAMREFGITTPLQQAMFLAQIGHESAGLNNLGEIGAGKGHIYGDWFGRGPIQLTGERNYKAATEYFGLPLLDNKDLAARPENGYRIAGWFWSMNVDDVISNKTQSALSDFKKASVRVNGIDRATGLPKGYFERIKYFRNSLEALNVEDRDKIFK